MKPIDKFGRPIFEKPYRLMKNNMNVLVNMGYNESRNKPNLFFKKDQNLGVIFFTDMRGTDIVPIWEDVRPLFYCKFENDGPDWKKRRIIINEMQDLLSQDCECRLSFFDECEPDGLMFSDCDGYCKVCGEDFSDDGQFCSEKCQSAFEELYKTHCSVCAKELQYNKLIRHHISYDPDKVIEVCRSCHGKIHKSKSYPHLNPQM